MLNSQLKTTLKVKKSSGTFSTANIKSSTFVSDIFKNTKLGDLDRLSTKIDSLRISIGYSDDKNHSSGLSYANLANILENGTKDGRIPARPYLERSSQIVARKLNNKIKRALKNLMMNPLAVSDSHIVSQFTPVGNQAKLETQRIIYSGPSLGIVNNSVRTIQKKGFNKPWVESGELVSNLESFVRVN